MPTIRSAHASLAATKRWSPHNAEAVAEAQRDLKAEAAKLYVQRLVDEAPALSAAQIDVLGELLRGGR